MLSWPVFHSLFVPPAQQALIEMGYQMHILSDMHLITQPYLPMHFTAIEAKRSENICNVIHCNDDQRAHNNTGQDRAFTMQRSRQMPRVCIAYRC